MVLADTINLPNLAGSEVMGFVLVLARVGGLFALAPGFSSKMIPAQAKLIIAAAISFALMPIAMHGHVLPTAPGPLAFLIMKEVLVGLAFALPLAMLGGAIQAGATLLDTMIGFSFASQVDPITNTQNAVISQLYSLFTVDDLPAHRRRRPHDRGHGGVLPDRPHQPHPQPDRDHREHGHAARPGVRGRHGDRRPRS